MLDLVHNIQTGITALIKDGAPLRTTNAPMSRVTDMELVSTARDEALARKDFGLVRNLNNFATHRFFY